MEITGLRLPEIISLYQYIYNCFYIAPILAQVFCFDKCLGATVYANVSIGAWIFDLSPYFWKRFGDFFG